MATYDPIQVSLFQRIVEPRTQMKNNQDSKSELLAIGIGIAIGLALFWASVVYAKWHMYPQRHLDPLLYILNFGPYVAVAVILIFGFGVKKYLQKTEFKETHQKTKQLIVFVDYGITTAYGIFLGLMIGRLFVLFHFI